MSFTKIEASGLDVGPLSGNRNKIINGDMTISQRGTTFVAPAGYTLDRFIFSTGGPTGGGVATVTQSTDAPNNTFQYSLKVDVTTADTSIAAGDFSVITHRIEGYNVRDLIGQTFTLSFWVKSPKTGVHCVSFRNSIFDRSHVLEYTVSTANTWEYKSVTVTGGLITAGTWDWTNGLGLDVVFTLLSGTTLQTTTGSWQTGNFIGTSNQVNVMDNVTNDFFLTGVQLEIGTVATPFERRPFGTELALCQRYYELISASVSTPLGTGVGQCISATTAFFQVGSFVPKRTVPVATLSGATSFSITNAAASLITSTGVSILNYGASQTTILITVASGLTAGNSSHLYGGTGGATVQLSSEL
jgi:hypothetical protein